MLQLLLACVRDDDRRSHPVAAPDDTGPTPIPSADTGPVPTPPVPDAAITPSDAVYGRDDLRCDADGVVSWRPVGGGAERWGEVLKAQDARASRRWSCVVDGVAAAEIEPTVARTNVMVVVLDDIGFDRLRSLGGTESDAVTPVLDSLVTDARWFPNAWATPVCSSTRALLVTGRYPGRTGIGDLIQPEDPNGLLPGELALPAALAAADPPYATAMVGKWHLGSRADGPGHPNLFGWGTFRGTFGNIDQAWRFDAGRPANLGYFSWERTVDGVAQFVTSYATATTLDDAIDLVDTLPSPWFVEVALHAAHIPYHVPPAEFRTSTPEPPIDDDTALDLLVESADIALGRLLDAVPPDTTVIAFGDNGTAYDRLEAPYAPGTGKGTVFEGGIRVPFFVTGPLVREPGRSEALVSVVDVFDTVLAIAGLPADAPPDLPRDSVSFLPALADGTGVREEVFTHRFQPIGFGPRATEIGTVRDERFKLVLQRAAGQPATFQLYDLASPAGEAEDLLLAPLDVDAAFALPRLRDALEAHVAAR